MMVKKLDEKVDVLPDHIGWRLWNASRAWKAEFAGAMRASGHQWFTEARAGLVGHIPRRGIPQAALIGKAGITKQAVQQLLDGLEAEGIVERIPDNVDRRGKVIRFTENGLAALRDGDRIKLEIEARYRARIGDTRFDALMDALRALDSKHEAVDSTAQASDSN